MIECIIIGEPDSDRKSCYDCTYCMGAKSWWCKNDQAIQYRGTAIPGVIHCPFWKPCRKKSDLTFWEKLFGDFMYIKWENKSV